MNLAERKYPIYVGEDILSHAGSLLSKAGFKQAPIVVTNAKVWRLHGRTLDRALRAAFGPTPVIRIGDGERFKNHETLLKIYSGMFRAHANRNSWLLAFGGGVVGDIAGFAAATFMRGIPYAMAPTTLLSQVDSSIGGKVAVNVKEGKNLVGAFHQPSVVLTDIAALRTLPKRELASGLYEVVKGAAIYSEPLLRYIERNLAGILNCGAGEMEHVIVQTAKIKAEVVASDERETGLRMILNYGHTVGHALESATHYNRFKHGEAVAWGMIAAVEFGRQLGLLQAAESKRLVRLVRQVGPLPSLDGISLARLWNGLILDKKFTSGKFRMILLQELGVAEVRDGIEPESLRGFLRKFLEAGRKN